MKNLLTILFIAALKVSVFAQADTSKYAIIPFSGDTKWLFKNCKPAEITKNDIDEIDVLLNQAVKNYALYQDSIFLVQEYQYHAKNPDVKGGIIHYPRKKPDFRYDLTNSKRQYIAVLNEKGEKEVFVNCFCNNASNQKNWKKYLITVREDEKCRFNLKINLTAKAYHNIKEISVQ